MGTACTRADERIKAAIGVATSASTRFEAGHDEAMAGFLAGFPALCANRLLSGLDRYLKLPKGFYSALPIVLVLGFMARARIRRPEGLRQVPPWRVWQGHWPGSRTASAPPAGKGPPDGEDW